MREIFPKGKRIWVLRGGMLVVLMVAWRLRLAYALDVGPFSDEYITMLAARSVLRTGWPVLPSGLFYDHGILYVYLEALFLGTMGFTIDIARLVSAFIGVLIVGGVYVVGRRWFSRYVGFLAAWLLTWSPVDIVWHGRARMYSLVQLTFLVGMFLLYEGGVGASRDSGCRSIPFEVSQRRRCWGIVALGGATLAHLLAIPYIGAMIMSLIVVKLCSFRMGTGSRLELKRLWPEFLLSIIAALLLGLVRWLGGPWGAGGRIITDPAVLLDGGYLFSHILAWMRLFITGPNILWSLLIWIAFGMLVFRLIRRTIWPDDLPWIYLFLTWLGSVVGLGAFSIWYADNYILGVTPLFYLLAAREVGRVGQVIEASFERRAVAEWIVAVATVVILILAWPGVVNTVTDSSQNLEEAFDYIRQHWRDGDRIATFAPHASLLILGQVDFYSQERGYPFIETDVGRVDVWTGTPVLDSVGKLEEVLAKEQRMWLLVHRANWQRHYSEAYRSVTKTQMRLVFDSPEALVYLSER